MPQESQVIGWRGRRLVDPDGSRVGVIAEVFVDDRAEGTAWALVKVGRLGRTVRLVPVGGARRVGKHVEVPFPGSLVPSAPDVGADGDLTVEGERILLEHYADGAADPAPPVVSGNAAGAADADADADARPDGATRAPTVDPTDAATRAEDEQPADPTAVPDSVAGAHGASAIGGAPTAETRIVPTGDPLPAEPDAPATDGSRPTAPEDRGTHDGTAAFAPPGSGMPGTAPVPDDDALDDELAATHVIAPGEGAPLPDDAIAHVPDEPPADEGSRPPITATSPPPPAPSPGTARGAGGLGRRIARAVRSRRGR